MVRLGFAGRTGLSLTLFYFGWWACALGAMKGYPWLGPAMLPFVIGLHLFLASIPSGEIRFLALLAFAGYTIDGTLIKLNLFTIAGGETWTPQWLLAMWILLGITFEGMLGMRRRLWLLMAVGGLTGPLSYIWCEGVNLLHYSRPLWMSLPLHAFFWAVATPMIFRLRDMCLAHALASAPEPAVQLVVEAAPEVEVAPVVVPVVAEWAEPSGRHTHSTEPTLH